MEAPTELTAFAFRQTNPELTQGFNAVMLQKESPFRSSLAEGLGM